MNRATKRIRGPNGERATRLRHGGGVSVERDGRGIPAGTGIIVEAWIATGRLRLCLTRGEALWLGGDLMDAADLTAKAWRKP